MQVLIHRKTTLNERLYSIGEAMVPPFALQYIIEGEGKFDRDAFRAGVKKLSELMPVLTLGLKGNTWISDMGQPTVMFHKGSFSHDWDDPFFRQPLQAQKGKGAEFHIFEGENTVIVFRVLHSIMDAKGAQRILGNLFAILRGETVSPDRNFPSDTAVRKNVSATKGKSRDGYKLQWPGFSIQMDAPDRYSTALIRLNDRLDASLARWASCYTAELGEVARFMIPVDLRRHPEVEDPVSNLTLPIYLETSPDQPWQDIQASLLKALTNNEELAREKLEGFGLIAPKSLLKWMMAWAIRRAAKTGKFPMSGILSDEGFMNLKLLSTPAFHAENVISLPVYVPLAPCCLTAIHHSNGTNITISVPPGTDLSAVKARFLEYLNEKEPAISPGSVSTDESLFEELYPALRHLWAKKLTCAENMITPDTSFHHLGGDSLGLLGMLSAVAMEYLSGSPDSFFDEALATGGHLTIPELIELIGKYRA